MANSILVVDDNQADRSRLEKILSDAGYMVRSADDGQTCLDAVKKSKPDAIFMDVNMPGMDGFAATRALRNDPATKDIPVVLVTAKDQKADKAWGQMLGVKGYITKPYTDDQIVAQARAL
jgi:twitching motility two-component system response regulator PilH